MLKKKILQSPTLQKSVSVNTEVLDQLRELSQETKTNVLFDVIDIFLNEFPDRLHQLQVHFINKSWSELDRSAHHFKSSCYSIGAQNMALQCEAIEIGARKADEGSVSRAIEILKEESVCVERHLKNLRNNLKSVS